MSRGELATAKTSKHYVHYPVSVCHGPLAAHLNTPEGVVSTAPAGLDLFAARALPPDLPLVKGLVVILLLVLTPHTGLLLLLTRRPTYRTAPAPAQ